MSLDGHRDAYIREKENELVTCELSRKRKLRELYAVNALLSAAYAPEQFSWSLDRQPDENESRFLDATDITKGLRFDDSALGYPTIPAPLPSTLPFQPPAKPGVQSVPSLSPSPIVPAPLSLADQLRAASASPAVASPLPPPTEPPAQAPAEEEVAHALEPPRKSRRIAATPPSEPEAQAAVPAVEEEPVNNIAGGPSIEAEQHVSPQRPESPKVQEEEVRAEAAPDGPSADPQLVIPPSLEDEAALLDAPSLERTAQDDVKPPQVVHLPPQEVQEARLKETEHKLEQVTEKERKEDARLAIPTANAPADAVSSPASTIGPYSQATPFATHHSPDTSPDRESFADRVPLSAQDAVEEDPSAQQAKEEHERALQQQMDEARARARGDDSASATPEVERQLEEEQAIRLARDGKSRLTESQPAAVSHSLTEHVEEAVGEEALKATDGDDAKVSHESSADSLPTPLTTVPEPSSLGSQTAETAVGTPRERVSADEARPISAEHPTPPADVDVEMDDAPSAAKTQDIASARTPTRTKSASDVLGETVAPKALLTPRSVNISATPSTPPRSRPRIEAGREVSTVIFAKQDAQRPMKALQLFDEDYANLQGASEDANRDYLEPLFRQQAHSTLNTPGNQPLSELINQANKTISTAGLLATVREGQDSKILKRVYQLQNANRWSLRQLQKSAEPRRPRSHLDHLLEEMKWLQTDFKEERKWKQTLAANLAGWCAEYVNARPEERVSFRIKARVPEHARRRSTAEFDMNDAPTPELDHSGANETESESFADDEELLAPYMTKPPAGIFSLDWDDIVWKMDRTPASDEMLQLLPEYEPNLEKASDVTPASFYDPPILPISKFNTMKIVSVVRGPPKTTSRYDYPLENEPSSPRSRADTAEHSMPSTPGRRLFHRNDLPPEMTTCALFMNENKHVRDRLQAAHHFKPPTEFPMPPATFFENRNSSQWLWEEDQKLRTLVKDYTFNWSLVAQELSLPSQFTSSSGRRTPWECFERWVQLEGLPAEMQKTPYFRTWGSRLEQAQKNILLQAQHQEALRQQSQQGQSTPATPRRRGTQPIRVERRRDVRHLAMIDSFRKLARKREALAHKQSEAQKAAALRKAHEPTPPQSKVHTPQEFSKIKWEREEKMKEKLRQHQQTEALNRQVQAQRQAQQLQGMQGIPGMQGQAGMPNGGNTQHRNGTPGNPSMPTQMANPASQQGHPGTNPSMAPRQHPGQQPMPPSFPNGNLSGVSMGAPGVPQAQMQATMQGSQRMAPPDQARMAMQRSQYPGPNPHHFPFQQSQMNMASNIPPNMNTGNGMPNVSMMAPIAGQGMNGNINSPMNNTPNTAGSPRMNQANPQMQGSSRPLSSGHTPYLIQLQNKLKQKYPDWTPERLQLEASRDLQRTMQSRQQAMSAAAGSSSGLVSQLNGLGSGLNGSTPSPQLGNNLYVQNGGMQNSPSPNPVQNAQSTYASQLSSLQQQQRLMSQQRLQANSPSVGVPPMSRSGTPQNPQQMGMQSPGNPQPRT